MIISVNNDIDIDNIEIIDESNISINMGSLDYSTSIMLSKMLCNKNINIDSLKIEDYFMYDDIDFYDMMTTENKSKFLISYYIIIISKYWNISEIDATIIIEVCNLSFNIYIFFNNLY